MHALNRKKTMFENVYIDWHLSHDEGSTDFSDDETLDEHSHARLLNHSTSTPSGGHPNHHQLSHTLHSPDKFAEKRPMSVFTPNKMSAKSQEWLAATDGTWARSAAPSTDSQGDSPESYRTTGGGESGGGGANMPPPPPPTSGKKPSICKFQLVSGKFWAKHFVCCYFESFLLCHVLCFVNGLLPIKA
jgi:hypothetical protein